MAGVGFTLWLPRLPTPTDAKDIPFTERKDDVRNIVERRLIVDTSISDDRRRVAGGSTTVELGAKLVWLKYPSVSQSG